MKNTRLSGEYVFADTGEIQMELPFEDEHSAEEVEDIHGD